MAQLVHEQLLHFGCIPCPQALGDTQEVIAAARAFTGAQAGKRVLPVVPEFRQRVVVHGTCSPLHPVASLQPKSVVAANLTLPLTCQVMAGDLPVLEIPRRSKILRIHVSGGCPDAPKLGSLVPGVGPGSPSPPSPSPLGVHQALSPEVSPSPRTSANVSPLPGASCKNRALERVSGDVKASDLGPQFPFPPLPPPLGVGQTSRVGSRGDAAMCDSARLPQFPAPGSCAPTCELSAHKVLCQSSDRRLTAKEVLAVLSTAPDMRAKRSRGGESELSFQWFSGAYVHGGCCGLRTTCHSLPWTSMLACRYVRQELPDFTFASVGVFGNILTEPHKDSHNDDKSLNAVIPLSDFSGGGVWVACPTGESVRTIDGEEVPGTVHDFISGPILFQPRAIHATERWEGNRTVLVAWTPRDLHRLEPSDKGKLLELGFGLTSSPHPVQPEPLPDISFSLEFGVRWTPEEFVAQATKVEHPCHLKQLVPRDLREAIETNISTGAAALGQERTSVIRKWIAWANELAPKEEELKRGMSENRRSILSNKRLLLLKRLLEESGHEDIGLFDDMCSGFSLVGKLPESGVFHKKFRPAELSEADLRQGAKRAREAIIGTLGPSHDPIVDEGVRAATQKEVQAGHVRGPVALEEVPIDGTVTRRFGVRQGETDSGPKVRPIDDYRESLVNAAVVQTEQVPVHSLDVVAATVSYWLQADHTKCGGSDLHVKCWDLHAAYKQLPLDDLSFAKDSFFGIYNPCSKQKELYKQLVLPFGSKASVTAFIRAAFALWRIALVLLKVVWTFYFDDFLNVCRAGESKHMEIVISMLFHLLGWRLSTDKLVPYSCCCKVLGIVLDLGQARRGLMLMCNTQGRKEELLATLRSILASGSLDRGELAKVRGRLQFASGQLFGRLARQAVHAFSSRGRLGNGLDQRLVWALEYLCKLLSEGRPREISRGLGDSRLIFVDASFEPGGYCGLGGLVFDGSGTLLKWFGLQAPRALVTVLQTCFGEHRETVIYELEALAVALAIDLFKQELRGRNVMVFTDNSGVHGSFVKCWSDNPVGNALAYFTAWMEYELHAFVYYDRVPSPSNPADDPSRGVHTLPQQSQVHVDPGRLRELLDKALSLVCTR